MSGSKPAHLICTGKLMPNQFIRFINPPHPLPPSFIPPQPEPPQIDLGQLGLLKSLHHSIRVRNRGAAAMATLTDNALKKVYHHVRVQCGLCVL